MFPVILAQNAVTSVPGLSPDAVRGYWHRLSELGAEYTPRAIGALIFIVAAWSFAAWLARVAGRTLARAHVEVTLAKFLSNIIRWAIIALSIVVCLSIFGVQAASFAAVIGSIGLAVGLALQGSLSNVAAGVMLLLFRPFRVGDAISVAGQSGVVDEVELFSTRIDTADKRRIIIPNAQVFNAVLENTTYHPLRRTDVLLTVAYDADIDATRRTLTDAAAAVPSRLLDRPPEVVALRFSATGVDWQVSLWMAREQLGPVREALITGIKSALEAAELPFASTVRTRAPTPPPTQPAGVLGIGVPAGPGPVPPIR